MCLHIDQSVVRLAPSGLASRKCLMPVSWLISMVMLSVALDYTLDYALYFTENEGSGGSSHMVWQA